MLAELRRCHERNAKKKGVRRRVEPRGRYPGGEICYDTRIARCYKVAKMKCHFDFEFEGLLERKRMRPVLVTLAPLAKLAVIVLFLQTAASSAAGQSPTPSLDFEYYRARVEPIFLKKRPGHARCVVCHARSNFEIVCRLVTPGDPTSSRLLLHPLSPKAGGDAFHSGGRQFTSQDDPDWRALADWVRNAKIHASTTP